MLGRLAPWRHVVVALVIVGCAALAFFGIVGAGDRDERFDAKQVTVQPAGDDGLRIREVVDIDFGTHDRHGYERKIPDDYGRPIDVTASSPDAPDAVHVQQIGSGFTTRIRVGDPGTTISGQHRYVLSYTLPNAQLLDNHLALDVIGDPDEPEVLRTKRFEVIVAGFDLDDPLCNVGRFGDSGGCSLRRDGDVYRTVISPLEPGEGITIGGRIVGRTRAEPPPLPDLPARRADRRVPLSLTMLPLGLVGASGVFLWSRRRGRNEVFAGGAAEAAYGSLAPPSAGGTATPVATTLVADSDMDELATIEFVPPRGVEPWQGRVLLTERIDEEAVSAWFSALVARDALTLERDGGRLTIAPGPQLDRLDPASATHIDRMFGKRQKLTLGSYDDKFAAAWKAIRREHDETIRASGWWKHLPPQAGHSVRGAGAVWIIAVVIAVTAFGIGGLVTALLGLIHWWPLALVFGLVVPAVFAYSLYRTLQPSRSATGSALALRTESFRRFLVGSEGQHVEWAWKQGLIREYSAWAVALDAADAWTEAMVRAGVPLTETGADAPLLVHSMGSSFRSTHVPPSSSGSGSSSSSSGGFSGGSVGGGGGGGSSGSW